MSLVEDRAARFENLVGSHLLKLVHYLQDTEGFKERLRIPWAYQVTLDEGPDFVQDGVRVVPASRFLSALV